MYQGQTYFRPPTWQLIMAIAVDAGCTVAAVIYWKMVGIDWVFGTLMFIAVLAGAGIVQLLTTSIELTETDILIRRTGQVRKIDRSDIREATWEAGCPASIRLRDGTWVKLPEVGRSTQALANSLRAWINRVS